MHPPFFPYAAAVSFGGSWSAYNLAIVVVMVFISIILSVAGLIMLLLGRFRTKPLPEEAFAENLAGLRRQQSEEFSLPLYGDELPDEPSLDVDDYAEETFEEDDSPIFYDGLPADYIPPALLKPRPPDVSYAAALEEHPLQAPAKEGADGEAAAPPRKPLAKSGLFHLLAAILLAAAALLVFANVDSPGGAFVSFTLGTGINLVLLAAQIALSVRFIFLQRRWPLL